MKDGYLIKSAVVEAVGLILQPMGVGRFLICLASLQARHVH
jgi:hypothetical protein